MRGPPNQITLVEVIRLHAAKKEFVDEFLHDLRAVIDTFEEDALVAEGNAAVGEEAKRMAHFGG